MAWDPLQRVFSEAVVLVFGTRPPLALLGWLLRRSLPLSPSTLLANLPTAIEPCETEEKKPAPQIFANRPCIRGSIPLTDASRRS
ncbi:hypothetical protein CEXT_384751 [Caerostris extrusa]|uniref:Secreted protein n=1 Tax=Caerostris extrusa TaxID=172846 RepID=A0AAV4RQF8_CAEEX|nr:hypothetical protein CEXT_384751 [Caerostris extrusa]